MTVVPATHPTPHTRTVSIELPAALLDELVERVTALVLERLPAVSSSPYLNVGEAAEYLRCEKQRIYDLLSAGRLTRFKDGSRVLVLRRELDELVAGALPPGARSLSESGVAA